MSKKKQADKNAEIPVEERQVQINQHAVEIVRYGGMLVGLEAVVRGVEGQITEVKVGIRERQRAIDLLQRDGGEVKA